MKHHKIKPIRFRVLRRKPRKPTILKKEFRVRKPSVTLSKAKWDKSKLIPVQKTIQGETGPYTAIRYCSQGEARSELNSALVRKYGNDVKYVKFEIKHGKHKGKQISVDQAIKLCPTYTKEESKKAKNPVALKDFIKNNFKAVITKPEENEEEPKTDNENRSKTSQKEKKPKKKQEKVDGIDDSRYNNNKRLKKNYRKRYSRDKFILEDKIKKGIITKEKSTEILEKLSKDMVWNKDVDSEFHETINAGIKEQTCMHLIGGHPDDMVKDWSSVKKVFADPDEILEQKDKGNGRKSYIHLRKDTDMIAIVEEIDNMSYKAHLKSAFIPDDGMKYVERKVNSMQPVWKKGEDENDQDKET